MSDPWLIFMVYHQLRARMALLTLIKDVQSPWYYNPLLSHHFGKMSPEKGWGE